MTIETGGESEQVSVMRNGRGWRNRGRKEKGVNGVDVGWADGGGGGGGGRGHRGQNRWHRRVGHLS